MGETEFQQRWEFRRNADNDLDSSCDDSKSSNRPLLKKHNLVSSLISVDDDGDETSETSRLKEQQQHHHHQQEEDNENPGSGGQINVGKAKKRKTRNMSTNLQKSKLKRDAPGEVDLQKGETSANDPAPLDDLKNFMDSLLNDLKVTRENLVKCMMEEMRKLVAEDATPEPKRKKGGHTGKKKVQLQQKKKTKKVQNQHEKSQKESMQFQHPNKCEKSIQVQHQTSFQETVIAQQENNFPANIKQQVQLQEEENVSRQRQNDFKYGRRTQNCNNRSLVRFPEGINALGDGVDSGQVTELITPSKINKGDSLSKVQTSCADQNVQMQRQKSVVLAIEAQKGKGGSSKRNGKGKKTVHHSDHYQEPEDHGGQGQALRTTVAGTNGEKLGSSVVQNSLSNPSGLSPSSMYLTLPTVLSEPIAANHGFDPSLCNYLLPRMAENKRGGNSERVNQMLEPSSNQGSFPVLQPEERIRSFSLIGSRNMGYGNQNSALTAGFETGFQVPFHQGIDFGLNITRQVSPHYLSHENSNPMGLRMNGGAVKFSGGSYNLSEHIAGNNLHSHPAYKSEGRLLPYQMQNIKDGHLFLQ